MKEWSKPIRGGTTMDDLFLNKEHFSGRHFWS